MKAAWIAAGILLLVVVVVICNTAYVNHTVGDMEALAASLPDAPEPQAADILDGLRERLETHESGLSLSVSFLLLDRVRELIDSEAAYNRTGDIANYAATRAMLLDALGDLKRLERVSVQNIM